MRFVRKNALVCSGVFTAVDGDLTAQPTNAELVVAYISAAGVAATQTIELAVTDGVWSGSWDSSVAGPGRVDWMVHCWNGLVAAAQGSFEVIANAANTG